MRRRAGTGAAGRASGQPSKKNDREPRWWRLMTINPAGCDPSEIIVKWLHEIWSGSAVEARETLTDPRVLWPFNDRGEFLSEPNDFIVRFAIQTVPFIVSCIRAYQMHSFFTSNKILTVVSLRNINLLGEIIHCIFQTMYFRYLGFRMLF